MTGTEGVLSRTSSLWALEHRFTRHVWETVDSTHRRVNPSKDGGADILYANPHPSLAMGSSREVLIPSYSQTALKGESKLQGLQRPSGREAGVLDQVSRASALLLYCGNFSIDTGVGSVICPMASCTLCPRPR